MAYFNFSSKIRRSLVLRVFVICLALLIFPVIVYASYVTLIDAPRHVLWHLLFFFLAVIFLGGAITSILVKRMAQPLRQLDEVIVEVEKGNLAARYSPDKLGFEINILGAHFNKAMDSIVELNIGHEIQKSLFPKKLPTVPGIELGAGIHFAKEVGGDFYDLFTHGSKLHITIADTSGKGVGACLYSLGVRGMLRSFASDPLQEAIVSTNNLFCEDTGDTGSFVTAWIGCYDPHSHSLEYSSCGHPHALLFRDHKVTELSTPGIALGTVSFTSVNTAHLKLQRGDLVILFTDGVTEARDENGKMFGKLRLIDAIQQNKHLSAQTLVDTILARISREDDDITLVALKAF